MRRAARALLLVLAFVIPWEYSLDLGPPLGNVARLTGLVLLLVLIPALLHAGHGRRPGALHWLLLALFVWFCCSCLWSIDRAGTLQTLRGYAQEFMIAFLVWELLDTPLELRNVLRAYVAGAWVLAALTVGSFVFASGPGQVRFVAQGQDPNDAARFLDLALPLAALLAAGERKWQARSLAASYLPLGVLAVLLTASRSGFLALLVALAGCAVLLFRPYRRWSPALFFAVPLIVAGAWITVPRQTLARLASIPQQLAGGDLNQRWNIWAVGWQAFVHAPFLGSGAGSFVAAAGLEWFDTAHNTALALAVEGGIVALLLGSAIVVVSAACIVRCRGSVRLALGTALLALLVSSLVATVYENRVTWLLLAAISVAARLAYDDPLELEHAFATPGRDGWRMPAEERLA